MGKTLNERGKMPVLTKTISAPSYKRLRGVIGENTGALITRCSRHRLWVAVPGGRGLRIGSGNNYVSACPKCWKERQDA
jgi:hypothetical protein